MSRVLGTSPGKAGKAQRKSGGGIFAPGINVGYEATDKSAALLLKPKYVRLELEPSQCTVSTVTAVAKLAEEMGAKLHLLVTFDGEFQTTAIKGEKISKYFGVLNWRKMVEELGPVPNLDVIEMGNETSYGYQYGDGFTENSYKERAKEYALLVKETAEACATVHLNLPTCQADDGNSGSAVWVNEMYSAVPNLHQFISAWTVHPYPKPSEGKERSVQRVERVFTQTGANGGGSIPIDITEWGIPTDNGKLLTDGTKLTYAEAAAEGERIYSEMRVKFPRNIRRFLIFQVRDQREPGTAPENREWYFGILAHNGVTEKGAWSTLCKGILADR